VKIVVILDHESSQTTIKYGYVVEWWEQKITK
jgi:hypothetical protein